jgi:hypothetical protein
MDDFRTRQKDFDYFAAFPVWAARANKSSRSEME